MSHRTCRHARPGPTASLALAGALLAQATVHAQGVTFTGIGFLSEESPWSSAYGVSSGGSVVVGTSDDAGGPFSPTQAVYWTPETGVVGIGRLWDNGKFSFAYGASHNGGVIVGGGNSEPGWQAFRWTETAGMVGLGDLPGGDFNSEARAVSGDGSVVVGRSRSGAAGDGLFEAFRWTEETGMVGLGFLQGGQFKSSSAAGISADGKVIVGGSSSAGGGRAYRWTEETGMVSLGTPPGGSGSGARGVSPNGEFVIGISGIDGFTRAFTWSEDAGMAFLPNITGEYIVLSSYADGVADDGTVVGMTNVVDENYHAAIYATLWRPGEEAITVEALLLGHGIDVRAMGWQLEFATGISADGRTIVGHGYSPNGIYEGWVVRIPATASLAPLALAALTMRRRR
ncbi:MAG TPA: hypothetical protein PLU35_10025 [Phycisphaerales bacterium]|nr:hypothetical protein [Phycisphaerales bacterium]